MIGGFTRLFRKVVNSFGVNMNTPLCRAFGSAVNNFEKGIYKYTGNVPGARWDARYAEDFENKYGVAGISHDYLLPEGRTARDIELELWFSSQGRMLEWRSNMVDKIIALNPELSDLKYDRENLQSLEDIIGGVTTGFNSDDIEYYVRWVEDNPDLNERVFSQNGVRKVIEHEATKLMLGVGICWFPALSTLETIKEQLGFDRNSSPTQSDLLKAYEDCLEDQSNYVGRFSFAELFPEYQNEQELVVV